MALFVSVTTVCLCFILFPGEPGHQIMNRDQSFNPCKLHAWAYPQPFTKWYKAVGWHQSLFFKSARVELRKIREYTFTHVSCSLPRRPDTIGGCYTRLDLTNYRLIIWKTSVNPVSILTCHPLGMT